MVLEPASAVESVRLGHIAVQKAVFMTLPERVFREVSALYTPINFALHADALTGFCAQLTAAEQSLVTNETDPSDATTSRALQQYILELGNTLKRLRFICERKQRAVSGRSVYPLADYKYDCAAYFAADKVHSATGRRWTQLMNANLSSSPQQPGSGQPWTDGKGTTSVSWLDRRLDTVGFLVPALLLGCGLMFWPTIHRYDTLTVGASSRLLRINRFTGYTEIFGATGWIPETPFVTPKAPATPVTPVNIPADDLRAVTGGAAFYGDGFAGSLYNGSVWNLTEVTIRIIAKEADGTVRWDRLYNEPMFVTTQSSSALMIQTHATAPDADWSIVSAKGTLAK